MSEYPFAVGSVGLFESAVVGYVLALGHAAVDVETDVVQFVGRVLVNDALRPLTERLQFQSNSLQIIIK